jgi:hypothetical protein
MANDAETAEPQQNLPIPLTDAENAWRRAVAGYCAQRRAKAADFARGTYAWRASMRLHRKAVGHDLWRAPANLAMAVPYAAARAGAGLARRLGRQRTADWLQGRRFFFATDLGRELEWRVMTQVLELPYAQPQADGSLRVSHRDALAEAQLADEAVLPLLQALGRRLAERGQEPDFRAWLTATLATYTGSRVAAADLTNALVAATAGGFVFHKLTPGALSLGPLLAQALATKLAAGTFPLGAGLGGLFFGAFPTAAPLVLTATVTGGLLGLAALLATFSGVLTDPIQQRLGLHRSRLVKLVDALELELLEGEGKSFAVRDHYVARLFDFLDLLRALQSG